MTNPKHTNTSRSGDLVERLRRMTPASPFAPTENFPPHKAADRIEALEAQIDRLASFIMHYIEGEPSQSQGAVDTAIRIMTEQATTIGEQLAENERLRGVVLAYTEYCGICHGRGSIIEEDAVTGADLWGGCPGCGSARAALETKP